MKTITLRTLLREPIKVKRLTNTGNPVQVTDKGEPLWVIHPAAAAEDDGKHRRLEMEAEFSEILNEPKSEISLSKIVIDSRR